MAKIGFRSLLLFAPVAFAVTSTMEAQGASRVSSTATPSIRVEGDVPNATTLTAAMLRSMPRVTVTATDHNRPPGKYEGVLLAAVLEKAGVQFGATMRGARLASYVQIEASDGYRVIFAIAELDSAFSDRKVLLVDRMNGEPLPDGAGPFRIVVPDEKRPARWVRQVTHVRLVSVPVPSAPPAHDKH